MSANSEKVQELIEALVQGRDFGKKGAVMNAKNKSLYGKVQKHLAAAGDYFGKAAKKYPDDEDLGKGIEHHEMASMHFGKMDLGPASTGGDIRDESVDRSVEPAGNPRKAAEGDFVKLLSEAKAELRGEFDKQIGELTQHNHALEIENAKLSTRLELLGERPAPARARVGLPTFKSEGAESLVKAASRDGGVGPSIDISKLDKKDPSSFRKALSVVRANPQRVTREMAARFSGSQG